MNENIRISTGKEYSSGYLTEDNFDQENEFGKIEQFSALSIINAIDGEADRVFRSIGSVKDKSVHAAFIERVAKMQGLLTIRLSKIGNLLAVITKTDGETAADYTMLQEEVREIEDILNFAETAVACAPQDTDYFFAGFLSEVKRNFEVNGKFSGEMATPIQFREYLYDKINEAMEVDTKDKLGLSQIKFPINDTEKSILDLYVFFKDSSRSHLFKGYGDVFEQVFAYANWRLASRKHQTLFHKNSFEMGDYSKISLGENDLVSDGTVLDVWEGAQKAKDVFPVPFMERARAASLIYENLHIISIIQNEKNKQKLGLQESATPEEVLDKKAELLCIQPHLSFLTIEEAKFLLNNILNFMPWERATRDQIIQTRKVIQIFCAGDVVRSDAKKQEAIRYGQESTVKYHEALQSGLKVKVLNGKVAVTNGENELSTDQQTSIDEMLKYGERAEGGAYSMFWAALQAPQADTGAIGYMKEFVMGSMNQLYAERYYLSDYVGPNIHMAKEMPRYILSYYAQMKIPRPGGGEVSLVDILSDDGFDMSREFSVSAQIPLGESIRLADNLKRAMATMNLVDHGIFTDDFAGEFDSFNSMEKGIANREGIIEGFRKAYKVLKYQVEMFVLSRSNQDWKQIIKNESVRNNILKEVDVLTDPNASVEAKKDAQAVAIRYWVQFMMLQVIKISLIDTFKKSATALMPESDESKIQTLKIKHAKDFEVLYDLLTVPGTIRRTGTIGQSKSTNKDVIQGKPFINLQKGPNFNIKGFYEEDAIGSMFNDAMKEGMEVDIMLPKEALDPFDLFIVTDKGLATNNRIGASHQ